MNKYVLYIIVFCLLQVSCQNSPGESNTAIWKQEIVDTELAFATLASEVGLHKSFIAYAAEDAVLLRGNKLVIGKSAIDSLYAGQDITGLNWTPDFVDVSSSGDLGYTYGQYTFTVKDSTGAVNVDKGVFHTVWKRQEDGNWKFVWD